VPFLYCGRDVVMRDQAGTVARGTLTGRTFRKRHWTQREYSNGIRDQDIKEQLHLQSERTSGRIFRKALVLEMMKKQRIEPSVRIWKMSRKNERRYCTQNKSQRCRNIGHSK
jgi:hypothetical protein